MKMIIEKEQFERTLKRMTHEIIEKNDDLNNVILFGIEKKGLPIATYISELIYKFENIKVSTEDWYGSFTEKFSFMKI